MQTGKKEIKPSLLKNDMPINVENTDKLTTTKNFLELSDYSKVEEYKLIN